MRKINILVVEDNLQLAKVICGYLEKEGFNVFLARDGYAGLEYFYDEKIDLAVIDWMMPEMDGISLIRKIREESNLKIIMLTAKDLAENEILSLSTGADDFVRKPFNPSILILKIKKMLQLDKQIKTTTAKLDLQSGEFFFEDSLIDLTKTEYDIIKYLFQNKGIVVSRDAIIYHIWGDDYEGDLRVVDTNIKRIREKTSPELILTKRGLGYLIK